MSDETTGLICPRCKRLPCNCPGRWVRDGDASDEVVMREACAVAWDMGYSQGVRDEAAEQERADNPFTTWITNNSLPRRTS